MRTLYLSAPLALLLAGTILQAQAPVVPGGEREPLLRLEAGGPTSFVTALAFSSDGKTLHAAGLDKVVRVWTLNAQTGKFELDRAAYRVPIGPGRFGMINAIALSPDDAWLAVGGIEVIREGSGFRKPGLVLPAIAGMSDEMREDEGTIYLFDTRTRAVRLLRGHRGPVLSMTFAPPQAGKPPLLVSMGREWDRDANQFVGVVRLWDLVQGSLVARTPTNLPDPRTTRAGLAVRHTGAQARQVQVGIAWMDGTLRVWDVERKDVRAVKDGNYNNTAAYLPGQAQLLTGSTGKLQLWNTPAGQDPQADPQRRVPLTPAGDPTAFVPWGLTLFSSQANGRVDQAAAVLVRARGEPYRLQLVDIARNFGAVGPSVPLWPGDLNMPAIVAAPRGRHLAVAGNKDHHIYVFAIADLLRGVNKPQVLQSVGTTFATVAFVRKGNDQGLLLRASGAATPANPQAGDLVFDFPGRTLTSDRRGWSLDAPAVKGWEVRLEGERDAQGRVVKQLVGVYQNNQARRRIELKSFQRVTRLAVLPPGAAPVPLVAVAYDEFGVPVLEVYNGETGVSFFQLSGHTGLIRSLGFSADGRLLVSAAEDQTVCVWSLIHYKDVLGKQSQLKGVALRQEKDGPVQVGTLDNSSLDPRNRDKLREGNVIEGIVENGQLREVGTPLTFYDALLLVRPGQQVTVRVRDGQGQRRDVALVVGQGVAELKPLFSLFVTRGGQADQRDWLGWSPLGLYDSSNVRADRNLGMHFNTGRPEEPARFALIDEYRKEHYREGILKNLVARASLAPALEDWQKEHEKPLPRPDMTLWIDELGPEPKFVDGQRRVLVQQKELTLKLAIDGFPIERIQKLEWQFDDGPAQQLQKAIGNEWTADLSRLAWKRGGHTIQAHLHTQEAAPRTYTQELALRYQPKRPQVASAAPERTIVDKPDFLLQASVRAGEPGQAVNVRVTQRHANREILSRALNLGQREEMTVEQKLKLQPGENQIEVVARNHDALDGYEDFETGRRVLLVTYTPPKEVPAPRIALAQVVLVEDETGLAETRDLEPGQPVIVSVPRIRILGDIQASDSLEKAVWFKGAAPAGTPLTRFEASKHKQWRIDEAVRLAPGSQTFRVLAKSATSPEAATTLVVEYRPRLPSLVLTAPAHNTTLYERENEPEVTLTGQLSYPRDRLPFKAVVQVNDRQSVASVDEATQTLTARVPLQPKANRIRVQLSNEWSVTATTEEIEVSYLRPPRILKIEGPAESNSALVKLTVQVDSALPLTEESVAVEVNERKIGRLNVVAAQQNARRWTLQLQDVPLDEGKNDLLVWVANDEGRSRKPGEFSLTYKPFQPPSPPVVEILDPQDASKVTERELRVKFRITSKHELTKVELSWGGYQKSYPVNNLRRTLRGAYDVEDTISLAPSDNQITVLAGNKDGEQSATVVVNFVYTPVGLKIDRLEIMGSTEQFMPETESASNTITFSQMPAGRLWLYGRVVWDKRDDEQLKQVTQVQVLVNQIRQLPALLEPARGQRERAFRASVFLNKEKNDIEVLLPNLKQEASNLSKFDLLCSSPELGQRLHLLIVGIGSQDGKAAREGILKALSAQTTGEGEFKTEAFQVGRIYGPLTGYVNSRQIFYQMIRIRENIKHQKANDLRTGKGSLTDVVMMYYQGAQVEVGGTPALITSESLGDPTRARSAIEIDDLATRMAETPGAQMLLLDVVKAGPGQGFAPARGRDTLSQLADTNHLGIMRSTWMGGQAAPPEARLLTNLEKGMEQRSKLKEVVSYVEDRYSEVARKYPRDVDYRGYYPPGWEELVVGQKNLGANPR